jgi:uncharacterized protein YjgD (DUF1641 family)
MSAQLDSVAPDEIQELTRLAHAAKDAMTDDMVTRLAAAAGDGMDLLDRVNRSGVAKALPLIAEMADNGDLERLVQLARVYGAAQDAVTDDMVNRLSATAGDTMDLLDRVNRSGVAKALPPIADMANNGDLERLTQLVRVYGAAQDAVTDDMVNRLSEAVGGGLDLLDQVNRADLAKAIPVIARMVHSGDLDRLADMARLVGSAQDALNDEMVGRVSEAVAGGLLLLDRLQRGSGDRLVNLLEHLDSVGTLDKLVSTLPALVDRMQMLERLLACVEQSATQAQEEPAATGGLGGLWSLLRASDSQDTLRFLLVLARNLQRECKA